MVPCALESTINSFTCSELLYKIWSRFLKLGPHVMYYQVPLEGIGSGGRLYLYYSCILVLVFTITVSILQLYTCAGVHFFKKNYKRVAVTGTLL